MIYIINMVSFIKMTKVNGVDTPIKPYNSVNRTNYIPPRAPIKKRPTGVSRVSKKYDDIGNTRRKLNF